MKLFIILLLMSISSLGNAGIDVFTEHTLESVYKTQSDFKEPVYEHRLRSNSPYTGIAGISHTYKNLETSAGFKYTNDIDIYNGNGYDRESIFIKIKYTHCVLNCK